ncbi:MAG: NYN domain-containing protein [Anaerolineae bacterium]|nr:NYN domain-containing protein [Anaerolineae bacterium]NUQ05740.1 NYN domain-containing protein [Anaerolineae bacterium]
MPELPPPVQRRLAMLIDGDNAQPSLMDKMIAEASKYGVVTIRRIYGDWTESSMKSWKQTLHTYAVQPIQQFRYTVGKNATDSALIIDAMDILYTVGVDGFCLVSSDSDYTKLAMRIREKNLFVMGIGRQTTPRAFVNACDTFVYTENLVASPRARSAASTSASKSAAKEPAKPAKAEGKAAARDAEKAAGKADAKPAAKQTPKPAPEPPPEPAPPVRTEPEPQPDPDTENMPPDLDSLFRTAFELAVGDDGWARLSALGDRLRQLDPGFDPRTYGHKQLLLLVQSKPELFEMRRSKQKGASNDTIYVRLIGER